MRDTCNKEMLARYITSNHTFKGRRISVQASKRYIEYVFDAMMRAFEDGYDVRIQGVVDARLKDYPSHEVTIPGVGTVMSKEHVGVKVKFAKGFLDKLNNPDSHGLIDAGDFRTTGDKTPAWHAVEDIPAKVEDPEEIDFYDDDLYGDDE